MRVALLGATRGMGRALARRMAERGDAVCLLGRDADDLERSASDLRVRGCGAPVATAACDLLEPSTHARALERAAESLGGLDTVVVTAGLFDTQEALEADATWRARLLLTNFTSTIQFCEDARRRLLEAGGGRLCVFSSVAGERARSRVVLYGATKAGLSYYLEGLDARFRKKGLVTVCVKPGFVRTGSTAALDAPPFAGEPESVADRVLRALDRGRPVVYAPGIWRWVALVLRLLPRFVTRRLRF